MALKMSLKVILVVTVVLIGVPGTLANQASFGPSEANNSSASQQTLMVNGYTGTIEIRRNSDTECELLFDLTCNFYMNQKGTPDYWNVSYNSLKATYAELDGRLVKIDTKAGNFRLGLRQEVGIGNHKLKIKYGCTMNIFSPDRSKLQIFAGGNHFHLTGNWFPVPLFSYLFNSKVRYDILLEIPKDWVAAGWGELKNDGKPDKNGHIKIVADVQDPLKFRLVGGKYNLKNIAAKKGTIKFFTFAGSKTDFAGYGKNIERICTYYEDYFNHPASGQYFIMETTGQIGAFYDVSGGFAADRALLEEGLSMGQLSNMISRMSWFGGTGVLGLDKQPDYSIFDRSFPSFASLIFCKSICPANFVCSEWEHMLNQYSAYRNPGDSAIADPDSARCDAVIEFKTPLALYALRNYIGDEKFKAGAREFFKKHALNQKTKSRIKAELADLKKALEKASGESLDDFWNLNFMSNDRLDLSYGIDRVSNQDGSSADRLFIRSGIVPPYPLKFRLFYNDGTSENIVFESDSFEIILDKPAGGMDFLDYYTIIPSPDLPMNTMATSSIDAACAWKKPIIYCVSEDGQECVERARQLEKRFNSDLSATLPDVLPTRPVFVTGKSAQSFIVTNAMKKLSIRWDDGVLTWGKRQLEGSFDALMLVFDPANPNTPIIFDTGIEDIPERCPKAAYFHSRDGLLDFSADYLDLAQKEFPDCKLFNLPWNTRRLAISGSYFTVPAVDQDGAILTWQGFDTETFKYGQMSKTLVTGQETQILLGLSGGKANLTIQKNDRFIDQTWKQELVCGKESVIKKDNFKLTCPKAVTGNTVEINWKGQLHYLANVDGKTVGSWSKADRASFTGLENGLHTIKLAFIDDDEMLSDVFTIETTTGAVLPRISFDKPKALYRNGIVTISGRTDPGNILDPPATIGSDGKFTINLPVSNPPVSITVKATNELDLSTSLTIPVVRYRRIEMWLGNSKAVDQDGNSTELSVPPQTISGVTCVPMRFIGESLGATVSWFGDERKVVYVLDDVTVELWIGKTQALVNGKMLSMPVPPAVIDGKTLVPARFISEALGASVIWEALEKKITIEYPAILL